MATGEVEVGCTKEYMYHWCWVWEGGQKECLGRLSGGVYYVVWPISEETGMIAWKGYGREWLYLKLCAEWM